MKTYTSLKSPTTGCNASKLHSLRFMEICLVLACLYFSSAASAQVTVTGSGSATQVLVAVDNFRNQLGGLNPNVAGSFTTGRREINWDGVPEALSAPNNLPANFFNVNSPRGIVMSTPGFGFQVSANAVNSTSTPIEFGNINPTYPSLFAPLSPQRLFTPLGSNVTDITFFVPGTTTPALTRGFGAVFSDVDLPVSVIQFFDQNNNLLVTSSVPPFAGNETFSFLGIVYSTPIISRVRITTGNAALSSGTNENLPATDLVVMDDFIYGEPVPAIVTCTQPTFLNNLQIVLDATCGKNDGNITIIPTSGTAPFMYSINGGSTYVSGPNAGYTFMNLSAATYKLRLKDANGCESAVVEKMVKSVNCPTCTPPTFLNNLQIVLDATCGKNDGNISIIPTSGNTPFMYSIDGGMTYVKGPNAGYTFINLAPGTYKLRLKDGTGCVSTVVEKKVNQNKDCPLKTIVPTPGYVTGIADMPVHKTQMVLTYPNPSKGQFRLQLQNFLSPKAEVSIFDGKGTLVEKRLVNSGEGSAINFNLSDQSKGMYYIKIVTSQGIKSSKILIQ